VYPLDTTVSQRLESFVPYALLQFLYYGAWETLFRGVLLLGLASRLGSAPANATQTALSVTAHFGRAVGETAAAFGAGLAFGWIALRARSVWYLAVIHWLVGVSQDWFILSR
jgi:membrane protease YdiL (CAAX protease family)